MSDLERLVATLPSVQREQTVSRLPRATPLPFTIAKMRLSTVGWAFFGLAVIVLISYFLNPGLYIGSNIIEVRTRSDGSLVSFHSCRYLYFSGIREVGGFWLSSTYKEAEQTSCPPLRISK
jgi:hypothetical protein